MDEQRLIRLVYCPECEQVTEHITDPCGDCEICTCQQCGDQIEFPIEGV